MGKKTIFLVIAASALAWTGCRAQGTGQSTLRFTEERYDFGRIKEADGPVSHTFEFTNRGDNPIVIERVSVSCGCTTPSYSRDAVLPGAKGQVKITYDPSMRPGRFVKEVYVISNGGRNNNKLVVEGEVEPTPRTVEQDYPYRFGEDLRLNSLSVNFRYVAQGTPTSTTLGYANTSPEALPVSFDIIPDDGVIRITPQEPLCAGCRGEYMVTATVPRGGTYGRLVYKAIPVVDGQAQQPGITINLIATDDFSAVGDGAPEARFSSAYHNFGSVARGGRHTQRFTLTNEGASDLIVRKVDPQQGFTTDLREGTVIAPGGSVTVTCTLDTSEARGGTYTRTVSIITNDPGRPMRELRLAASVPAN